MTLPGFDPGRRAERFEWGARSLVDHYVSGKRGHVEPVHTEAQARGYDGAYYPGGPRLFEPVCRTIVTYTGEWEQP